MRIEYPSHDYFPVLHVLDLKSLADRRVDNYLMFLSKIISSFLDVLVFLGNTNFLVPISSAFPLVLYSRVS